MSFLCGLCTRWGGKEADSPHKKLAMLHLREFFFTQLVVHIQDTYESYFLNKILPGLFRACFSQYMGATHR